MEDKQHDSDASEDHAQGEEYDEGGCEGDPGLPLLSEEACPDADVHLLGSAFLLEDEAIDHLSNIISEGS